MGAPVFNTYFPSVAVMTDEQRNFYTRWLRIWQNGEALCVDGQISYLFCYLYTVLERHPRDVINELTKLANAYSSEREPFLFYCQRLTSDCYVVLGDCAKALKAFPKVTTSGRASAQIDSLLSLKLRVGARIEGHDLIPLAGPHVTSWGKEHLTAIVSFLNTLVQSYERNERVNLLERWSKDCHKGDYQIFTGTLKSTTSKTLHGYSFSLNTAVTDFATQLTRESEDTCREEIGLPRVGEGWISETSLYYAVKKAFPNFEVIQHARPEWLGKQHIDIYLPQLAIAIEYQGEQHNQPIAYFGGHQSFSNTQRRDRRKQRLCKRNGIKLIYVHPGYNPDDITEVIGKATG